MIVYNYHINNHMVGGKRGRSVKTMKMCQKFKIENVLKNVLVKNEAHNLREKRKVFFTQTKNRNLLLFLKKSSFM